MQLMERLKPEMKEESPMSEREEKFERMLRDVQHNHADVVEKMEKLKAAGKEKTATYRQLLGDKLMLQNILSLYRIYGLLD